MISSPLGRVSANKKPRELYPRGLIVLPTPGESVLRPGKICKVRVPDGGS